MAVSEVPEREVAAAATTAARDVRPESRRRRPPQRLTPGPLVSRTRARVEEQGRREARLESTSRAPSGAAGDCSPRPTSAEPVRERGESSGGGGGGGSAGRALSRTPRRQSFPTDPLARRPGRGRSGAEDE